MARAARGSVAGMAYFGIVPGIASLSFLLMLPAIFIPMLANYPSSYMGGEYFMIAASLLGLLCGSFGGYYLMRYMLMLRFEGSYASALERLYGSALPLLVVDEDYCAGIVALAKERWSNLFAAPPASHSLDEQLNLAACYINLLTTYQFSTANRRSPILRHGNNGYFSITPAARVINAIGSFGGCVPYIGCFGYLLMPFAIRNLLRFAEQRGALCAICAYFSDPRAADWLREVAPATSTPA